MGLIAPWLNSTIKVQRRASNPTRNAYNEPDYGNEASFPVVYASVYARLELYTEQVQYLPTGERLQQRTPKLFVEDSTVLEPQDRVTFLTHPDTNWVNKVVVIQAVVPYYDSVGNLHHYICEIQFH